MAPGRWRAGRLLRPWPQACSRSASASSPWRHPSPSWSPRGPGTGRRSGSGSPLSRSPWPPAWPACSTCRVRLGAWRAREAEPTGVDRAGPAFATLAAVLLPATVLHVGRRLRNISRVLIFIGVALVGFLIVDPRGPLLGNLWRRIRVHRQQRPDGAAAVADRLDGVGMVERDRIVSRDPCGGRGPELGSALDLRRIVDLDSQGVGDADRAQPRGAVGLVPARLCRGARRVQPARRPVRPISLPDGARRRDPPAATVRQRRRPARCGSAEATRLSSARSPGSRRPR